VRALDALVERSINITELAKAGAAIAAVKQAFEDAARLRNAIETAQTMIGNGFQSGHMVSADAAADLLAQFEAAMKERS
jgi:hypothetical protein